MGDRPGGRVADRVMVCLGILGMVFFLARFAADIYRGLGDGVTTAPGKKTGFYALSHRLFPFDALAAGKNGRLFLEQGYQNKDNRALLESIGWFRRAIARDPFDYYAHYYLAKSYLFHDYPRSTYFAAALAEFKKAAMLRYGSTLITLDTSKILLGLWPFLNENDRQFCRDLLGRGMGYFTAEEFGGIIAPWWLHCKDRDLLLGLLEKRPDFFHPTATTLLRLRAPLELRRQLLAKHEIMLLEEVNHTYRALSRGERESTGTILPLLEKIGEIRGYHTLAGDRRFDYRKYVALKIRLLRHLIDSFFNGGWEGDAAVGRKTLHRYIADYMDAGPDREELADLREALRAGDFFGDNDFVSAYFKYLTDYRLSDFSAVIKGIEALTASIAYVNTAQEEQRRRYIDLQLLLVDAYEATRLLTEARSVLMRILETFPDHPDALLRLLRIRRITGGGGDFKKWRRGLEIMEESRRIRLKGGQVERVVYFNGDLTGGDGLEIEIEAGTGHYLLQVFIDGKIRYESYVTLSGGAGERIALTGLAGKETARHVVGLRLVE